MQHHLQHEDALLDAYDFTLACQSIHHDANDAGTVDHGGDARYFVFGPCVHTTGLRCEPSVLSAMSISRGICERCRSNWPRNRFTYHRLDA